MPTVATKNGGPVDIMSTLHHGLLVDPTNSAEIAAALIKILTHPETWDEMSRSGARCRGSGLAVLRSQVQRVGLAEAARSQRHCWLKGGSLGFGPQPSQV